MWEPFRSGKRPKTLLSEPSPYGSCRVTVESDRMVTAAYVLDAEGHVRSVLWLANHLPAPHHLDQKRVDDGLLPPMPAGHTRHQEGRRPPSRRSLGTVWFPDGDGVAITERGVPLGVLSGWPDETSHVPGYSRGALGRTHMAWTLDGEDALEDRVVAARDFWRWHAGKQSWTQYQGSVLFHLERQLGPGERYWSVDGDQLPRVGLIEHPPSAQRPFGVLSTVGMSCQRMPLRRQYAGPESERIEIAVATSRTYEPAVDLFTWLGRYPWRWRTRLGAGHYLAWDTTLGRFPLGDGWEGLLMLADPGVLLGPAVPDLSGFTVGGDPVRWLWLVPLTRGECTIAAEQGTDILADELRLSGRDWITRV